eukprot:scaffold248499_cov55-Attheya_sp.AAC.2
MSTHRKVATQSSDVVCEVGASMHRFPNRAKSDIACASLDLCTHLGWRMGGRVAKAAMGGFGVRLAAAGLTSYWIEAIAK